MKFKWIVLLSLLVGCQVNASAIRNSFVENINSGIKWAEKIFGLSNNVADLVSRSFSHTAERKNARQQFLITQQGPPSDNSFLKGVLRLMGVDASKVGAAAVNGIIFIAQMIGNLLSTRIKRNDQEGEPLKKEHKSMDEEIPLNDPIEMVLQNENVRAMLKDVRDKNLTNELIGMVQGLEKEKGETDCIQLFICKLKPFIFSMQKAIILKIDGTADDSLNEIKKDNLKSKKEKLNRSVLFQYFPESLFTDFKSNGGDCEEKYSRCKLFDE